MELNSIPDAVQKKLNFDFESEELIGDIRPWGGYVHIREDYDSDEKFLWVNSPTENQVVNALSLQFHGLEDSPGHDEFWIAHSDALVVLGSRRMSGISSTHIHEQLETEIKSGLKLIYLPSEAKLHIPAGHLHALMNPFRNNKHVIIHERRESRPHPRGGFKASAAHREQDIMRVLDETGRDGALPYTHENHNWILAEISRFIETASTASHAELLEHKILKP